MTMRWEAFLAQVQERGEYATPHERAARTVLALLGAHLAGEVRAEPAARLPETFALILLNPLRATEPLPPERFLRATAAWIEGATEQTAAWDVGAVLTVTAEAAGGDLTNRVLLQLPPGYDLLRPPPAHVGRRSDTPPAPAPDRLPPPAGSAAPPLQAKGKHLPCSRCVNPPPRPA